jgi:hypothetical protein
MTRRCLPVIAILLMLAVNPGCQHLGSKGVVPAGSAPADPAGTGLTAAPPTVALQEEAVFAPGQLRAAEIPGEIAGLELTSRNFQASVTERAEALRRLALLHLAPQNPARSPALAAEAQSAYLQLRPGDPARQEGEIWLALILDRLESERLLRQQSEKIRDKERACAELGAEKQRLAQKIADQEAANAKLKADIEKLKFIDLSVEKKRKSFR